MYVKSDKFKALFSSQEMPRCQDFASFCRQLPGSGWPPRLKGRSFHFPPILDKIPSIQNLNETTVYLL